MDVFSTENEAPSMLDHDEVCMAQANQLLLMGCLEYEAAVYGCAYLENGEIYYYLSARKEQIKAFCQNACLQNIYHTPVHYFCKRYDLLDDSEEEINQKFRLEVAKSLSARYPRLLFDAAEALRQSVCANAGFGLVKEIAAQLENGFDIDALTLFADLLDRLLEGRLLNQEAYLIMSQWLKAEYEKNAIETIPYGAYKRQYAGFAYEKAGKRGYFADALPYLAEERRSTYLTQGYLVSPILTKTYYSEAFTNPLENKKQFLQELQTYLNDGYLALMQRFRQLPATIDSQRYHILSESIQATGQQAAIDAWRYQGYLCNVL